MARSESGGSSPVTTSIRSPRCMRFGRTAGRVEAAVAAAREQLRSHRRPDPRWSGSPRPTKAAAPPPSSVTHPDGSAGPGPLPPGHPQPGPEPCPPRPEPCPTAPCARSPEGQDRRRVGSAVVEDSTEGGAEPSCDRQSSSGAGAAVATATRVDRDGGWPGASRPESPTGAASAAAAVAGWGSTVTVATWRRGDTSGMPAIADRPTGIRSPGPVRQPGWRPRGHGGCAAGAAREPAAGARAPPATRECAGPEPACRAGAWSGRAGRRSRHAGCCRSRSSPGGSRSRRTATGSVPGRDMRAVHPQECATSAS